MRPSPYKFSKSADGTFYRCTSHVPGEGVCLVRKVGREWQTAVPAPLGASPDWAACPVSTAANTRKGAVMAHFYYHRTEIEP